MSCKSLVLASSLDEGIPGPDQFRIEVNDTPPTAADCSDGDILVQLLAISADPYLRGAIKSTGSTQPGDVMKGFVVGKILASNCHKWSTGDLFGAHLPFSTVQLLSKEVLEAGTLIWKLTDHLNESNISIGLGESRVRPTFLCLVFLRSFWVNRYSRNAWKHCLWRTY